MDINVILITALAVVLLVGLPLSFVVGRIALRPQKANAQTNTGGGGNTPPPGGTGATAQTNTGSTQNKVSLGRWLLRICIALLLLTAVIFVAQFINWSAVPFPSWVGAWAPFLVVGAIITALFLSGIALMSSGKKGAGVVLFLSFLLLAVTTWVYWYGPENVLQTGRNSGEALAHGGPAARIQTNCIQGFCTFADDGLPIIDGNRQQQPFHVPRNEETTFYAQGEDVQIYYDVGFCAEVLPSHVRVEPDADINGIGHIYPRNGEMTKVVVITKHRSAC